jgi:AcrR family transcriptional regulator
MEKPGASLLRPQSGAEVPALMGVTRPALYYYFRSKEELLAAIYDRGVGVLIDRASALLLSVWPPDLLLRRLSTCTCARCFKSGPRARLLLGEGFARRRRGAFGQGEGSGVHEDDGQGNQGRPGRRRLSCWRSGVDRQCHARHADLGARVVSTRTACGIGHRQNLLAIAFRRPACARQDETARQWPAPRVGQQPRADEDLPPSEFSGIGIHGQGRLASAWVIELFG